MFKTYQKSFSFCMIITALWSCKGSEVLWPVTVETLQPGPPSPDWESLNFYLSGTFGESSTACKELSDYYCLDTYYTQRNFTLPEIRETEEEARNVNEKVRVMENILGRNWKHINFIDEDDPLDCCLLQTDKYLVYGYLHKRMSPEVYWDRLSNYENESRPLNNIAADFFEGVCKNVVFEVGFGPGALRRHHGENIREGVPYVILGKEFADGIPEVPSITIDYFDPGSQLTFQWFKHHIMCRDHPSICGQHSPRRHARKKEMKQKVNNGRNGSRKARRKQQQQDWQQTQEHLSAGRS